MTESVDESKIIYRTVRVRRAGGGAKIMREKWELRDGDFVMVGIVPSPKDRPKSKPMRQRPSKTIFADAHKAKACEILSSRR